jgi:hypothetical protein
MFLALVISCGALDLDVNLRRLCQPEPLMEFSMQKSALIMIQFKIFFFLCTSPHQVRKATEQFVLYLRSSHDLTLHALEHP